MEEQVQEQEKATRGTTRADQLSPEKHRAIELMLDGWAQKDIAAELGVDESTITKWKRQRVFAREYNKNAKSVIAGGMSLLRASYSDACEKLISMMHTKGADRVQLEAARSVIKMVKDDELVQQFAERLERLEQTANREP
jgi:transcriptional regulator with XRE-family HTH domain